MGVSFLINSLSAWPAASRANATNSNLLGAFICHARDVGRPSARRPSDCKGPSAKALAAWTHAIASAALSAKLAMFLAASLVRDSSCEIAGSSPSNSPGLRRGFTLAPLLATNLRLCCGFAGGGRSWTMACSQSDSLQRADTHPPLLARQAQSPLSAHARRMSRDLARTQQDLRQRGARAHAVTLGKVFSDSPAMAQRSSGHGPATLRIGKPQQGDASVLMQALNDQLFDGWSLRARQRLIVEGPCQWVRRFQLLASSSAFTTSRCPFCAVM
jgi:hypothetical protein